jgi:eukaryotic-like serine/threonine-protein kinase
VTPERWQEVKALFEAALKRAPAERAAFLNRACAADESLCHEVESLIAAHAQADSFMEAPAVGGVSGMMIGAQAKLAAGQRIAHYEIVALLGAGGMGEVYLAQDAKLGRRVALKLLPTQHTEDKERLRRFEQEARAASALNHPNILTVYEVGRTDNHYYIATEHVDGVTLRQHLAHTRMKLGQVLEVAAQIAAALAAAHEAGIVHRDIKPENIMLRPDGYVKVLDFGLAKLVERKLPTVGTEVPTRALAGTAPGIILGTVAYMSPEQARGLEVDTRTDIFSLGIVLYEMVVGRQPFVGATALDVLTEILQREPDMLAHHAPDVPRELAHIVMKALRKDREERYQTVKDMLIDLRDLKRDLEVQAQLERSTPPELRGRTTAQSSEPLLTEPAQAQAVRTGAEATARTASRAEYLVHQVKSHKRGALVTLGMLALAAAVTLFLYLNHTRAAPLTEKDTILLADFDNTTGDAVFDGALKQALAIQLEQSPFLNIFSDQRVREVLPFMNRSPDERVTKEVAREICERQRLKAYLSGSIANLGSHLVITLEAVNAQTGDTLARQQVEAESKEQVLGTLGQAATKLREKLGESLASIQKYDVPIEQATTSSLEALKAFSQGKELNNKGRNAESILFFKRAFELDPNFARAYDALAIIYNNLGQQELSIEAAQKAFELRDGRSEYEKLKITSDYYHLVTNEMEKAVEAGELLTRTYPRDHTARNNLALTYIELGRYEQGAEEARAAIRLNSTARFPYLHLARALICLNRFAEAKEVYEQTLAQKLDIPAYHADLYTIAFVQGDTAAMQRELDWMKGKPDEEDVLAWQVNTAAFLGQLRKARELHQRLIATQPPGRNLREDTYRNNVPLVLTDAYIGNCQQAREDAVRAATLPHNFFSSFRVSIALSLCGDLSRAQSLADGYAKRFPNGTWMNSVWLPTLRATIEMRRNNPAGIIQSLQLATPYYGGRGLPSAYLPQYFRGQAYLAQGAGAEAAAEFQKILEHRGLAPTSVLYPLAQLGLARAAALAGDVAKARRYYQDFFALWKDADGDIPVLVEAKKEYGKLK